MCWRIQSRRRTDAGIGLATGWPRRSAVILSSSCCSRANRACGGRIGRRPERGRGRGFDLGLFFGLQLLFRERGPVVIAADGAGEQVEGAGAQRCLGSVGLRRFPLPLHGPAMHAQRAGEGLDGGEQPLLQAGDQEAGGRLLAFRRVLQALLAEVAVLVEQGGRACSSGASSGRPSMSICTTCVWGNRPGWCGCPP